MFERQFYDDVVVVTVNRICLRQYPVQKSDAASDGFECNHLLDDQTGYRKIGVDNKPHAWFIMQLRTF